MKKFNLEAALNGEPVILRDGRKAIIYHRVPDIYTCKNGVKVTYPVVGMTFNTDGTVDNPCAAWMDNGRFTSGWCGKDIVGMHEEPKISIEDLPKPFKPNDGEQFYYIYLGEIYCDYWYSESSSTYRSFSQNGRCFRTKEDAQKWLDFMKSMME
jgi:hypothetical protein|nr:MAG TPA: hypothetical protein [Caudoviricetes sp.]